MDPWFIISGSPDQSQLIHTARKVNDYKPQWVVQKIYAAVLQFLSNNPDKTINEVSVSLFGLAFKANIDDLRESPALSIAKELVSFNFGRLLAVEPNIADLPAELKSDLELIPIEKALELSDICVVLVDHDEFKLISKSALEGVLVVDTKGIWRSEKR